MVALYFIFQILVERANKEIDIIAPGYTHLQRAQPIRWSHFLLRYKYTNSEHTVTFVPNIIFGQTFDFPLRYPH